MDTVERHVRRRHSTAEKPVESVDIRTTWPVTRRRPCARNFSRRRRRSSSPDELPRARAASLASDVARAACAASSWSVCAPPAGSGTIASMTPSSRQCAASGLERGGGLPRLARVAPEDRGAALGRDHRVDRVLLHQHAVGERDRDRAAGAALADDARDRRHARAAPSAPASGRSRRPGRAARRPRPGRRRACRRA